MSFERRQASKSGYGDENHGTRVSSPLPPPPPPPFFHGFWHTENRAGVRRVFFFSYFIRPARSDRFLFSSANFPPRVSATLVNAGCLEDDTWGGRDSTSTFTAGCSFRSVKRVVLRGGRPKKKMASLYAEIYRKTRRGRGKRKKENGARLSSMSHLTWNKRFFKQARIFPIFQLDGIGINFKFFISNFADRRKTMRVSIARRKDIDPSPVKYIMILGWRNKLSSRYTLYGG